MTDLILQISAMTSMDIAEITSKQHQHIMRDIRDEVEKLESAGIGTQSKFGLSERQDNTGRTIPFYILTKEGVLQLAARYDAVTRSKLIEMAMKQDKQLPSNYKEALLALVAKEEETELLVSQNYQQKQLIEEQKPQVMFANAVTASSTSILVGDLSKILKKNGIEIGEIRLWEWLRQNGYAIKEEGRSRNMPTQRSMDLKVMEVKEGTNIDSLGNNHITKTTLITGKGQLYFVNKFLKPVEAVNA